MIVCLVARSGGQDARSRGCNVGVISSTLDAVAQGGGRKGSVCRLESGDGAESMRKMTGEWVGCSQLYHMMPTGVESEGGTGG